MWTTLGQCTCPRSFIIFWLVTSHSMRGHMTSKSYWGVLYRGPLWLTVYSTGPVENLATHLGNKGTAAQLHSSNVGRTLGANRTHWLGPHWTYVLGRMILDEALAISSGQWSMALHTFLWRAAELLVLHAFQLSPPHSHLFERRGPQREASPALIFPHLLVARVTLPSQVKKFKCKGKNVFCLKNLYRPPKKAPPLWLLVDFPRCVYCVCILSPSLIQNGRKSSNKKLLLRLWLCREDWVCNESYSTMGSRSLKDILL